MDENIIIPDFSGGEDVEYNQHEVNVELATALQATVETIQNMMEMIKMNNQLIINVMAITSPETYYELKELGILEEE